MTDEAFKDLVKGLTHIAREYDLHPPHGRATAVVAAVHFLRELKVSEELMRPLREAIHVLIDASEAADYDGRPGPKPKPWLMRTSLGIAAALVTALSACEGWTLDTALKKVARETKFDCTKLRTIRDNIHRGKVNSAIYAAYYDALGELSELPAEGFKYEVLERLNGLAPDCC